MPKAKTVSDAFLAPLIGKRVKVYVSSGVALSGVLKKYDKTSLVISGRTSVTDSLIERSQISTIHSNEHDTHAKTRFR